jgi:hypothetical protein
MAKTISNKPQHITIPKKTAQGGNQLFSKNVVNE